MLDHYAGQALVISYDRYYKTMPCGNYDIPEALDTGLLLEHLHLLKAGQAVDMPIYRTNNRRTNAVQKVEPKPLIIVEGIFALYHPQLLKLYHSKVFVEATNDLVRLNRRIVRDFLERGDSEVSIRKVWKKRLTYTLSINSASARPSRCCRFGGSRRAAIASAGAQSLRFAGVGGNGELLKGAMAGQAIC